MRLALVGDTGFVGSAVAQEARARKWDIVPIGGLRAPAPDAQTDPSSAARHWIASSADRYAALVSQLGGSDVLVNAGGLATPGSIDQGALNAANAVIPSVLAQASAEAGVRLMVHVSTAAVQGRQDPLDESPQTTPITPYGRSKAWAEAALLDRIVPTPPEVVVYRPTSVQGVNRATTRGLVAMASRRALPVAGRGDAPVPVALIQNVAAGIVHVCASSSSPPIVLQPWEGMTARSLLEALGPTRLLPVPSALARLGLWALYRGGAVQSELAALARRLEVLVLGQSQDARALHSLGFVPPAGPEEYVKLAAAIRLGSASHRAGESGSQDDGRDHTVRFT